MIRGIGIFHNSFTIAANAAERAKNQPSYIDTNKEEKDMKGKKHWQITNGLGDYIIIKKFFVLKLRESMGVEKSVIYPHDQEDDVIDEAGDGKVDA